MKWGRIVEAMQAQMINPKAHFLLCMTKILQYLKDPNLWELWYVPYSG